MTTVVAGVLERDRKTLICRRRVDGAHPLKWEFPGGKVEPGEDPAQGLARELREELGIDAEPGAEIMRYPFAYPGKEPILLIFFEVTRWAGEPQNRVFDTIAWEKRDALAEYDFLEGDGDFLASYSRELFPQ
jgi:8-oxo-dGTP diphosphatase